MAKLLHDEGAEVLEGQIFGVAGLLVGLGGLRELDGFCLLAETLGLYPDRVAAEKTLKVLNKLFKLEIDLQSLGETVQITQDLLSNFGLVEQKTQDTNQSQSKMIV
jgi:proteasome assembly chaperone (PAC2) family protein